MPAGTSTLFFRNGTEAISSADGELLDSRDGRVCGVANGYAPSTTTIRTPSSIARSVTVAAKPRHAASGSGPVSTSTSSPVGVRPTFSSISGHTRRSLTPSRSSIVGRRAR